MRWRTPLASLAILASLILYVLVASLLSEMLPDNIFINTIFYLFAGIAWLPPVIWIMGWATTDPDARE
jgi:hypothetical protein